MAEASPTLANLIRELTRLPGIGARSAERLAFHLLSAPQEEALALARAITDMRSRLTECSVCHDLADADPCAICGDQSRERSLICVVETSRDVARIEGTGLFKGLYHVLKGHVAPAEGVGPDDLTIGPLVNRVESGGVEEIILATNPTLQSDATALEVAERLKGTKVRITRLARGLPAGGTLEYVSRNVLSDALSGRQQVK
ncbi:MAG: recombination protein RecR [Anaerolineaceae bacterium]|nr:recombination protein RecR [Anaerolineaceae bacterium]